MNTTTLGLAIALLCYCAQVATSAKSRYQLNNPECNTKFQQKTDMAVAKLMGFGPHGRNFPENQQQLKAYCRETTQLVDQIESYFKKCYKKEIRDLASVLVYSIKSNVRTFCRKKTRKLTKLMENTPCINRNFIQEDKCLVLYANNTGQLISQKADDLTKIRHACCFYVSSMKCSEDVLDSVPCIRHNKELMLDFVRGIFGSFIDVMCGEYNEQTNRCDELAPLPKSKSPTRKRYNTFLFVLLDLLESLKNFGLPN